MKQNIIRTLLKENNADALVSFSPQTRLWFTGFIASDGIMVFTPEENILYMDGRYFEAATEAVTTAKVVLLNKESMDKMKDLGLKTLLVESNYLTVDESLKIKKLFKNDKFININGQSLRISKTKEEIEIMKEAGSIALKALKDTEKLMKAGVSEVAIRNELSSNLKKHGASTDSFDAIVVSGERGSLPHGKPSEKLLKDGELLTIDFGALYRGYCSDITRTFHVGTVTDKKTLEIEEVLRAAQKLGVAAVKPGVTTGQIDKVCRDYITEKGFGKYFVHSTGHGLGIDVHELPNVTSNKAFDVDLKEGMVITVEPGIYIPGVGGIRVEDDILVTKDGHYVLSQISH
ncbi:MAG: aminopeptidase P family protein [Mycoplasmataceae bacterium]|nr:aminopeptidase P family protein [Mycoplasmataceae bacterium]